MNQLISPTAVFVETQTENFWWSVYGFKPSYEEDVVIHYQSHQGDKERRPLEIITAGHFRDLSMAEDNYTKMMLAEECALFGKTLKELETATELLYARSETGYEHLFSPAERITIPAVRDTVRQYCRDHQKIPFCSIKLVGKLKRAYSKKTFREDCQLHRRLEEMKQAGVKFAVRLAPAFLEDLFGTEALAEIKDQIHYGYLERGNYFVVLHDSSERLIGEAKLEEVKAEEVK